MSTRYETTHNDWDPHAVIPFAVPKFKAAKVYVDPTWGINIVRISADGKAVPATAHPVLRDDLNFSKTPIGNGVFVYQIRRLGLVVAKKFTEAGAYELVKYEIPEKAKSVVIEYQLRESPDVTGPVITLESTLV